MVVRTTAHRRTDARLTAAEQAQKQRGKQAKREKKFQRKQRPVLEAMDVAEGLIRAQELADTHALKKRVGKLQRGAAGYLEVEPDDAATALREAANIHERNARRTREAVEANLPPTAKHGGGWNAGES